MRQTVALKVYGHFSPVSPGTVRALEEAVSSAIASEEQEGPIVTTLDDVVRFSFEGVYFPADDVVEILEPVVAAGATGRLDILDMEAWEMTRYAPKDGVLAPATRSLNHVLDYSGF